MNGVNGKKVLRAVVPVDTVHMDVRPDTAEGCDALRSLAEYFQKSVATKMCIRDRQNAGFRHNDERFGGVFRAIGDHFFRGADMVRQQAHGLRAFRKMCIRDSPPVPPRL